MVTFEFVENFVKKHFDNVRVRRNRINCRCLFCGDSKKSEKKARFNLTYYSPDHIIYHCFNCEESGSFTKLYANIKNISTEQAKIELGINSFDYIKDRINGKDKEDQDTPKQTFYNYILDDCISEDSPDEGGVTSIYKRALLDFKTSRKIPKEIKLYIAYNGKYAKRIIIPIFDENGNVVYFQARALSPKAERKYLNPTAEKSIIPNFHHLESPVVITEGLIDSLMLGAHGTCCLGASISEDFIEKIKDKELIIALDNDSQGYKSLRNFLDFNKYSNNVKYFLMPDKFKEIKDLNDLKVLNNLINIFDFVLENSHSKLAVEVKLRFDSWRK